MVASVKSLSKNRIERCGHQGFSEFSLHCPNHAHGQKFDPDSQNCQNTFCRDRMARDCTIRHLVWPIVALQRRMRFSARLAGFCKGRWHQRRARRAEEASFSVLVSNLDFRVPRLRPNRRTGADRVVRPPKRGHPRGPESKPGRPWRSWPSKCWSSCGPSLLYVHLCPGPGSRSSPRERGIPFLDVVSLPRTGGTRIAGRNVTLQGYWCHLVRIGEDLHDRLGSTLASRTNRPDIRKQSYEQASPRS